MNKYTELFIHFLGWCFIGAGCSFLVSTAVIHKFQENSIKMGFAHRAPSTGFVVWDNKDICYLLLTDSSCEAEEDE